MNDVIDSFRAQTGQAPQVPSVQEISFVLRTIAITGPHRRGKGRVKTFASLLWNSRFKAEWHDEQLRGKLPWTPSAFYNLIIGRNQPPRQNWRSLHKALAEECIRALGSPDIEANQLIEVVRTASHCLLDCVDRIFDYLADARVNLTPQIDAILAEAPFWLDARKWCDSSGPLPAAIVQEITADLECGAHRIAYVQGEPFSAKRDVLKAITSKYPSGYLQIESGRRLPIFARAVGAITPEFFIDRVFNFYRGKEFAEPALRSALSTEAKLAIIRVAAKREAVLFIVSDIDPFDQDAIVRRLRGDLIGDVLQAVIDGHPLTRLVIGISATQDKLPWSDRSRVWMMQPSYEEFSAAADRLSSGLAALVRQNEKRLSGISMRLAMPVLERAMSEPRFPVPTYPFLQALENNDHDGLFSMLWRHLPLPEDRILLGLIASSHDGLRLVTLERVVNALKRGAAKNRPIVQRLPGSMEALRRWGADQQAILRWRQETDASDSETSMGAFYFREAIRRLVLESWMSEDPPLAREGMWLIAREAAHQARDSLLQDGQHGAEAALARNLQALYALTASLDAQRIDLNSLKEPTGNALHLDAQILPPLSVVAPMPDPTIAYRYAWNTLYRRDIEAGEQRLLSVYDDPLARLDALFLFIEPDRPWVASPDRKLCQWVLAEPGDGNPLGAAARGLKPAEQLELLAGIGIAAMRQGHFHAVRDAAILGRRIDRRASSLAFMRLMRAETDLGILCAGNPDARLARAFCKPSLPSGCSDSPSEDDFRLTGVAARLEKLLAIEAQLDADGVHGYEHHIVRGKLFERLGEVHFLRGERIQAAAAFRCAVSEERQLATHLPVVGTGTIIGGRGARNVARFVLYKHLGSNFDCIVFSSDGFRWPTPHPGSPTTRWIRVARAVIEINKARLARGHLMDRLGVLIDEARLAMSEGNYEGAEQSIDIALQTFGRGDSSLETLLELSMLRAIVAIEVTMRLADPWGDRTDEAAREALLARAARVSQVDSAFARLVENTGVRLHRGMSAFLQAQSEIVASRAAVPGSKTRVDHLLLAREKLEWSRTQMASLDYKLNLQRVDATLRAVSAVLQSSTA